MIRCLLDGERAKGVPSVTKGLEAKYEGQRVLGPEGWAGALSERTPDTGRKGTGEPCRALNWECQSQICLLARNHWLEWRAQVG